MLGTHVPRRIRPASARMNADAVGFSSTRKKKRAARGVVDTLLPSTATRETSSDYSRRVGRRDIAQELQRKAEAQALDLFDATNYLPSRAKVRAGTYADANNLTDFGIKGAPLDRAVTIKLAD